jgi:hypothetical protein
MDKATVMEPGLWARAAAVSAMALVLAGCTSPAVEAPSSQSPSSRPTESSSPTADSCADNVDVSIDVNDADIGSSYLVFTNSGTEACALTGFPTVLLQAADGGQVGVPADHADEFERAGTAVEIAPSGRAFADFIFNPSSKIGNGTCEPIVQITGLIVTVPGASASVNVPMDQFGVCTGEDWMTGSSVGPVDSEARIASN